MLTFENITGIFNLLAIQHTDLSTIADNYCYYATLYNATKYISLKEGKLESYAYCKVKMTCCTYVRHFQNLA